MSVVFLLVQAWLCGLMPTLSWATIVLKIIKSLWETFGLAVLSLGLSYISKIIIRPSSTFTHEDSRTVRCSHLHSKPSFAATGILTENVLTHDCKWQKASPRVNSYPLSLFFQMSNTNVHTHFWLYCRLCLSQKAWHKPLKNYHSPHVPLSAKSASITLCCHPFMGQHNDEDSI